MLWRGANYCCNRAAPAVWLFCWLEQRSSELEVNRPCSRWNSTSFESCWHFYQLKIDIGYIVSSLRSRAVDTLERLDAISFLYRNERTACCNRDASGLSSGEQDPYKELFRRLRTSLWAAKPRNSAMCVRSHGGSQMFSLISIRCTLLLNTIDNKIIPTASDSD